MAGGPVDQDATFIKGATPEDCQAPGSGDHKCEEFPGPYHIPREAPVNQDGAEGEGVECPVCHNLHEGPQIMCPGCLDKMKNGKKAESVPAEGKKLPKTTRQAMEMAKKTLF